MSWLAPWLLAVGAIGAGALAVLHLVARQRPASYLLPTARFVPEGAALVSRIATRPRDLLLLVLRMLLALAIGAALAQPVMRRGRGARARIVVVDRSVAVLPQAAQAQLQAVLVEAPGTRVLEVPGTLSAGLIAARRLASTLGRDADSLELVMVSSFDRRAGDAALDSIRALWPARIRLVRLANGAPSGSALFTLDRGVPRGDVLGPALADVKTAPTATVLLRRGVLPPGDSARARDGSALVRWDAIGAERAVPSALVIGDDVVVAPFARLPLALASGDRVLARWSDGSPAAIERNIGRGCLRIIAAGVPEAGDLPLRNVFQRVVRGLVAPCAVGVPFAPMDSLSLARLTGSSVASVAASSAALGVAPDEASPYTPWLLGLALGCALLELVVRALRTPVRRP